MPDREMLGRLVRHAWVRWAREQPDPKPSWLVGWDELDAGQREVDMRIGETVAALVEHDRISVLQNEVRAQQTAAERRNRDLDALHLVWCDGGCPSGVHRYDPDAIVTEEMVAAAERNTARLRRWYEAVKFRYETYGPAPADPARQFRGTASEWHRHYAMAAARRTDLPGDAPEPQQDPSAPLPVRPRVSRRGQQEESDG